MSCVQCVGIEEMFDEKRTAVGCRVCGSEPNRLVGLRRGTAREQEGNGQADDHEGTPHGFMPRG